jgi:hypothetical protein
MTIAQQDPGWVTRTLVAKQANGYTEELLEQGFGVEVVSGGQFIDQLLFERGGILHGSPIEDWHDGKVLPCPAGHDRISLTWTRDSTAGRERIVLRVFKRAIAFFVADRGLGAQASFRLLESVLHTDSGAGTVEQTIAAGGQLDVHDGPGQLYQKESGSGISTGNQGALPQSRVKGDDLQHWWPTPALFFDGWIAASAATFEVWAAAYAIDGNVATRSLVAYDKLPTPTTHAGPPFTTGGYNHIVILRHNVSGSPALPYPKNGARITIVNTDGVNPINVKGVLGVRSA